jgi:hypothetical protein
MYITWNIFVNFFCCGRCPELPPVNELKARRQVVTTAQSSWIARLATLMRSFGPYAAIELLLPGGSLIALSLWIFRHREDLAARVRRALAGLTALCASLILRAEAPLSVSIR